MSSPPISLSTPPPPPPFLAPLLPRTLPAARIPSILIAPDRTPKLSYSSSSFAQSVSRSRCRTITACSSMTVPAEEPPPRSQNSIPPDSLSYSRAYWVCRDLIAWNISAEDTTVYLYASKGANLFISDDSIEGHDVKIHLEHDKCGLPTNVTQKFPHISNYTAFKLPESVDAVNLLKCQLAVASFCDTKCSKATGLQLPGVLDDLFSYSGPLGALFSKEAVSLYLWAPTAQLVRAYVYKDHSGGEPMASVQLEEVNGVWNFNGPRNWEGCYYVYEVCAFHSSSLQIETCRVNDPYARGISPDGKRTLLVNLDHYDLKPNGWDELADEKPVLSSFSDISIYELHIRDFSARDQTVDHDLQGGYLAFTCQDSDGIRHLRRLSEAGLTHVHLLPSFHFGGVDDMKDNWKYIDHSRLAILPPDSDQQQTEVMAIKDEDGYNWGYNPIIWGVPKGSYARNPNGPSRTLEFRRMVQALNRMGLRVVLDVVYNHVHGSGPLGDDSLLDKVVPGYYLRRNTDGFIEHSTCTNNTASEHFMVERLILDDLLCWAVHYKVDGFRFDLMGHIMKSTMVKAKCALQSLSKDKDGLDGSKIYIYGEGWDFGEVAKNGRGINASQFNISGSGIGSFNDRIRDAVIGGSPFGHPLQQGFVTGLSLQPNGHDHGDELITSSMLAASVDQIQERTVIRSPKIQSSIAHFPYMNTTLTNGNIHQVGLAANLKDFVFTSHKGEAVKGSEVLTHGGAPLAYASCPTETVNYVSAHDNETLFDIISLKTPVEISVDERCRINCLATSIVALSQGIPFFHAGDEILRSKSLDRDSYNSGDWFNRLDFSYQSNNWGVGLPPQEKNINNWPLMKPRLADTSFKPLTSHIRSTLQNFENFLRIRYSSPLFRLGSANAIQERVCFHNTGPSWLPGIIAMSVEDGYRGTPGMAQLDPIYSYIVIIINARPTEALLTIPSLRGRAFQLHPVQLNSADRLVKNSAYTASSGCFTVPHRTTSVFVEVRGI